MTIPQSAAEYAELLRLLADAKAKVAAAETKGESEFHRVSREQYLRATRGVISFLNTDPAVREAGLAQVLARGHNVFHDVAQGARPNIVMANAIRPNGVGGRPTDLISDHVKAHLAFALDTLITDGNIKNAPAISWLTAQIVQYGIRAEDGAAVTARQLERWRYDVNRGKAAKVTRDDWRRLQQVYRVQRSEAQHWPPAVRAASAQRRACLILQNLANLAPHDAPAERPMG